MTSDSLAEILKGIRCYFDKALPVMLLYKLFVKLPELLAYVSIEEETLTRLQQKLTDFLKFLQKNHSTFFLSTYDSIKGVEGKGKGKDD
ncbi:hypothetical protein F8388_004695 [Cannabis sativa]|uniref:MRG domain-containing protein n=1 Tax=Cannabis sativa TaxID=3483 RepID=A0A7J6HN85_CANSA|nr:hypothetical protein F8388_004695 [Cannabis sativa]